MAEANTQTPASAAAPVAAAAPQAPSPDSPPAAAPAEAVPAATPEPAAPVEAAPQLSLLQKFDAEAAKPAETKPAETPEKPAQVDKPADEAKPAEAKPADKPAEKPAEAKAAEKAAEAAKPAEPAKLEPVAYEYELPATIKMDDGLKTEFHTVLDGFRADPAKGAQGLIALHEKAMTDYDAQLRQQQIDTWNETRKAWNTDVLADEQIGGSCHQTAMGAIARMRDMFVPEKDRAAFENFLSVTGAGDHPAFLKMLHNAARFYDEPAMPPPNVKPSPTNGANPNNRRAIMYDHPRSPGNRQ